MTNAVTNIFSEQKTEIVRPSNNNGLITVEAERAIAEIKGAIVLAKNFPRDQEAAFDRIMNACQRQTLAENAVYAYARGGTSISGPSIRLAEAISQHWGNIQYGTRELERRNGESIVEAFAWDCETNTRVTKVFTVKHKRDTKAKGSYTLTDERDIYELIANQGARRLRSCILSVIPGDVTDSAVEQCKKTLQTNLKITDDSIKSMIESFKLVGVSKEQIEKRIQRNITAIEPAQFVKLREIYASLKDGMSEISDWFDVEIQKIENKSDKILDEINKSAHEDKKINSVLDNIKNKDLKIAGKSQDPIDSELATDDPFATALAR